MCVCARARSRTQPLFVLFTATFMSITIKRQHTFALPWQNLLRVSVKMFRKTHISLFFFFFKFSESLLRITSRMNETSLCTYAGSREDICPIILPSIQLYLEVGTFALPPRKSPYYPYSHCDFHLNNLHTTAHTFCVPSICPRSLDILVILNDDS